MRRSAALQRLPEAKLTEGVSIDDYSTWRAVRLAERDQTRLREPEIWPFFYATVPLNVCHGLRGGVWHG